MAGYKKNGGSERPRQFHRTEPTGAGRRTYSDRFEGERGPKPERRPGERPMSNPPRTGGYRPVPKATFDGAYASNPPRRPMSAQPVPPPPPAEMLKDPVLRNAAERAARAPRRFEEEQEIPENLLVGRNPIREAIKTGHAIEKLLVARGDLSGAARDIVKMALERGVVVQEVDRVRLDQIYRNHQGMLAYSVGLTPAAVKAAAGATEYMPVAKVTNINRTIEELQQRGVWVMASAMNGENIFDVDLRGSVAIVIGSEGDGVSALTLKKCDRVVSLPMKGHIDSLNASVAAGAMMYAVLQSRR